MEKYIFVHGLGQTHSSWDRVVSHMPKQVRAFCPDLPSLLEGGEVAYQNLYRAFENYCDSFPAPLNLCGLSLGGILALNYAADYPARVRSLALIAVQYKMPKMLMLAQNIIFRFMPESFFRDKGFRKKELLRLTASMTGIDFRERLKDISCPALVICGANDGANKKAGKKLAQLMPEARFQLLGKAGHEANIEEPQALAEALAVFFRDNVPE